MLIIGTALRFISGYLTDRNVTLLYTKYEYQVLQDLPQASFRSVVYSNGFFTTLLAYMEAQYFILCAFHPLSNLLAYINIPFLIHWPIQSTCPSWLLRCGCEIEESQCALFLPVLTYSVTVIFQSSSPGRYTPVCCCWGVSS